jgi:hypothetical protein
MRRDDFAGMIPTHGVAVELGVAGGKFSEVLLKLNTSILLYSIDRWCDHHNDREYLEACARLSVFGPRSIVIRSTFADALAQFDVGAFDFIYIDGYAHTGQDGGKTLEDWWPKLKAGGVFAGHDYSARFPLNVKVVDNFVVKLGLGLHVTNEVEEGLVFRSWWVRKPEVHK